MKVKNHIYRIFLLSFLLLPNASSAQRPEQDCFFAKRILCVAAYTENDPFNGPGGNDQEINPQNASNGLSESCFPNFETNGSLPPKGEKNSVWYSFVPQINGQLKFTIDPSGGTSPDPAADFDWIIYDLDLAPSGTAENRRCEAIRANHATMIAKTTTNADACNASRTGGPTGAEDAGGATFTKPVQVIQGHTYVICVNRFSTTSSSFTLDFTNSDPRLLDARAPMPLPNGIDTVICTQTVFSVLFDEPLDCATVGSGDFEILDASNNPVPITSITVPRCSDPDVKFDDSVVITLSAPFGAKGDYRLFVRRGGDGNTVADACGNFTPENQLLATFHVACSDFTFNPNGDCINRPISFTDLSEGKQSWTYTWDFGDGVAMSGRNVLHTYTTPNTYTVTFTVTAPGGTSVSSKTITIVDTCTTPPPPPPGDVLFNWPDAFVPGGTIPDFGPVVAGNSTDKFSMKIFNRWGEMVFTTNDPYNRWDGTYQGFEVPRGAYLVVSNYTQVESGVPRAESYYGLLTVIR